ncbi:MAG TPA: LysR family transcriptional regulator [Paracoccaceae bacterium]|nr:LysR family transcriptional regulator [Paracoccaceae bacterium]
MASGLDLVDSFLVVAEELNFRRSAERLHIDQSALTRRIQKLEQMLGFRLLERTTREVALTPAGRTFYEENIHLLTHYEDSIRNARRIAEGKTGLLRVAYMAFAATELMPNAVARFQRHHPHVDVRLRYIRTQGQKLALANDEIDIGFMIGPFDHSEYHTILLASEPLHVVVPRNHPLARRQRVLPEEIAEFELILGDMIEWGEYRWRLDDLFTREGIRMNIRLEASNTLALMGLVAAGLGITIYPESLISFLGRSVEVRPIVNPAFRSETILVWKRTNRAKAVMNFVDIAKRLPVHA